MLHTASDNGDADKEPIWPINGLQESVLHGCRGSVM